MKDERISPKVFGFTIKGLNTNRIYSKYDYETLISAWNNNSTRFCARRYELDSKNRLHVHGIIESNRKWLPNYNKSSEANGYHIYLSSDIDTGWVDYISKEARPYEQLEQIQLETFLHKYNLFEWDL